MKRFVIAAAWCGILSAGAMPADAAQGCGRGFHPSRFDRCIPTWHRHRWHRW